MRKITPHLWFEDQVEEAVNFYLSIFRNSAITEIMRYEEESAKVAGRPVGSVLSIAFTLNGNDFVAINGGPMFKFTPAVSFLIDCENQEEIDHFWDKLLEGGEPMACGWLTDKYGVTWQVAPGLLDRMLMDKDPQKVSRVMAAMLKMVKIDLAELKRAYEG